MTPKVVLITGVADYWGSRLADRLLSESELQVIGVDVKPPPIELLGLDFVQADVRNPSLAELLESENVHTVCHLKFVHTIKPSEATHTVNVIGTANLLNACAQADVSRAILKSSTAVYGAHPDNPIFLSEDHALRGSRSYGYIKDLLEIESLNHSFRQQAPRVGLTVLRYANIVGPTAQTPMTRFLSNRWAPLLLGFDPMMQIIHEDDVVQALAHAVLNDVTGVFNVAAERAMPLSQIVALSRKLQLPIFHPLAHWGVAALLATGGQLDRFAPIEPTYLRYSCLGDSTKMRQELGFAPRYTAEEILHEFATRRRHLSPLEILASDQGRLRNTIERRRRIQEQRSTRKTGRGK